MNSLPDLFGNPAEKQPEGLVYRPDFISRAEEAELAARLSSLPFSPFEFQGFVGKRRTVSYGWHYAFDGSGLREAEAMPDFILPVRDRTATLMGVAPEEVAHALIIEYSPGAGIGWHRDRPVFGTVAAISLLAPARLRFRRRSGEKWERTNVIAEPRSAYVLNGPARAEWEHSIPPMETLRYSLTFRTLKGRQSASNAT